MALYQKRWDVIGIAASVVCLIHCVALPVFIGTLSVGVIALEENNSFEYAVLFSSLCFGGWGIMQGYKIHGKWMVHLLFCAGIGALFLGSILALKYYEPIVKLCGGLLLACAHLLNWKNSRDCNDCKHNNNHLLNK